MEVKATQLQLPWEVSESTSQLLTVLRGEVKKNGSSRNIWSVLPGRPMLNVWHQDSSSSQGRPFPLLFMVPGFSHKAGWAVLLEILLPACPSRFTHTMHRKYLLASHRFPSEEISLLYACLFRFIYLCAAPCFPCQRGVNSPWATKVLGQI